MKHIIQEYWVTKTKYEIKLQQSPFQVDTSFENTIFMATTLIVEELKQIEKSHEGSLNNWVGVIMHNTVQTRSDLQYIIMSLSGYMNAPTEYDFIDIKHGMEYLMQHPHESIMYSIKKIYKTGETPHQSYLKAGDAEIKKIRNIPTSFTHIVIQIIPEIYLIDVQLHQYFISSMLHS